MIAEGIINTEPILRDIDQVGVFKSLFGDVPLGKKIHSPFRVDTHPSCQYRYYGDRLMLVDFSRPELTCDCITAIQKIKHCSFGQALGYLTDIGVGIPTLVEKKIIKVTYKRKLSQEYIDYWNSAGVDIESEENVKQISELRIDSNVIRPDLGIVYKFNEGRKKFYFPKDKRFYGSAKPSDLWGVRDREDYSKVIITKSMKDALVLKHLNLDDTLVISVQGESFAIPSSIQEVLYDFFDVYLLWDNDEVGRKEVIKRKEELKLYSPKIIELPKHKDPYDFAINEGVISLKQYLNEVLD